MDSRAMQTQPSGNGHTVGIAAAILCILVMTCATTVAAKRPAEVVISEVCVVGTEYVELYNQTDHAIVLDGWSLCYFPAGRTAWDAPLNHRTLGSGLSIQPNGYLLLSLGPEDQWTYAIRPDIVLSPRIRASDVAGALALFSTDPTTTDPVDAVAWGDASLSEGGPADAPSAGESLSRVFRSNREAWALVDTDDNQSDLVSTAPTPANARFAPCLRLIADALHIPADSSRIANLEIRNAGSQRAGFTVHVDDTLGWKFEFSPQAIVLSSGEQTTVPISVARSRCEFIAVDVETTGLSPEMDEIIEIAWCRFVDGMPDVSDSALICPSAAISRERLERACAFTGIPMQDVLAARGASEVLPEFCAVLGEQIAVSHSSTRFDQRFFEAGIRRIGEDLPQIEWMSSIAWAKEAFPGRESYALNHLAEDLGIWMEHHRALPDAIAAGLVYWHSLLKLGNNVTFMLLDREAGAVCATLPATLPLSVSGNGEDSL